MADLAREDGGPGLDECGLMIVRQNRWRAARFGLEAGLVDPRTGRPSPARDVIKGLVERLRETAEGLGCATYLDLVRAMSDGPGGAERQLAVFERTGDLAAVARHMTGGWAPEPVHPIAAIRDFAGLGPDVPGGVAAAAPGGLAPAAID